MQGQRGDEAKPTQDQKRDETKPIHNGPERRRSETNTGPKMGRSETVSFLIRPVLVSLRPFFGLVMVTPPLDQCWSNGGVSKVPLGIPAQGTEELLIHASDSP